MARQVHCVKLKREAEGLDFPPYPGELGRRIFDNVSKEAWKQWLEQQKMLVNVITLRSRWKGIFSAMARTPRPDSFLRRGPEAFRASRTRRFPR
jgi:hypothetical protein